MDRALHIVEVAVLIRQELKGCHLKTCVLVCRLWWKLFGPFLWESIFIDKPDEDEDEDENKDKDTDRHIIFRNGLAAKMLTLSIYDPLDRKGSATYGIKRCRNITKLHLKLYSKELVAAGADTTDKLTMRMTAIVNTPLLDTLLANVQNVTDLTLTIADPDLQPQVISCASKLPKLRKLTLLGGPRMRTYNMKLNRLCDWNCITRTVLDIPTLETLDVSWECPSDDAHRHSDVTFLQPSDVVAVRHHAGLKRFHISHISIDNQTLAPLFSACPMLRQVTLTTVKPRSKNSVENTVCKMAKSCKNLQYFSLLEPSEAVESYPIILQALSFVNNLVISSDYLQGRWLEDFDMLAHAVTTLEIREINSFIVFKDILEKFPGVTCLTFTGTLRNDAWDHSPLQPLRASNKLESLNITNMTIRCAEPGKEWLFDWIQNCERLKRLYLRFDHVEWALLHDTWDCPDEFWNITTPSRGMNYIHPRWRHYRALMDRHRFNLSWDTGHPSDPVPEQPPLVTSLDRRFRLFPAVECLDIGQTWDLRATKETTLDEHMISALIRAMPKIKSLSIDDRLTGQDRAANIRTVYSQIDVQLIKCSARLWTY
ncbi:hypothetical protein BG004_001478 [Podila humilis]|nr:hypothetical protein BG004_001478 [Podila humilis]